MIIGVTGYAQHGKDSTGNVLIERHGFVRYAFADQLKSMALALNPVVQSYTFPRHPDTLQGVVGFLGWEKAKELGEVRRFLQVLGTEGVRDHLGEDAWINALDRSLNNDGLTRDSNIVITDVRFPNEALFVHRNGGEVWRVKRLTKSRVPKGPDEDPRSYYRPFDNGISRDHPSEKFIGEIPEDRVLVASNLDELAKEVERAWAQTSKDANPKRTA